MPMYDRSCNNGHQMIDCWEPINSPEVVCDNCGASTNRVWLTSAPGVIPDDIPGGILIKHGLCDQETGEPRRYYSKTEIMKEAAKRGLTNQVTHVTDPRSGSDKSKHTSRWV